MDQSSNIQENPEIQNQNETLDSFVHLDPIYRYAGHAHWERSDLCAFIESFLKDRFESYLVYYIFDKPDTEKNAHKLHIQFYGETTTEWSKTEDNQWRKSGKYYKYLRNQKGAWSCIQARQPRENNTIYCLKNVPIDPALGGWTGAYLSTGDLHKWVGRYRDKITDYYKPSKTNGAKSFQSQLVDIWELNGKPSTPNTILDALLASAIPWSKMDEICLSRAVNFLWHKSGHDMKELREAVLDRVFHKRHTF